MNGRLRNRTSSNIIPPLERKLPSTLSVAFSGWSFFISSPTILARGVGPSPPRPITDIVSGFGKESKRGIFTPIRKVKMKMLDKILKFLAWLPLVCRNIAVASILMVVASLALEGIVRKVVGVSIITVNEIGGIGMYIFVTCSICWIYGMGGHLRADFLVAKLPPKVRYVLELFLHLLTLAFACFVTYRWWRMFIPIYESGRYYVMTGIVEWPFHLLAMIAWGMLGLTAVARFMTMLRRPFNKIADI
jgi:TRAP-type C4-dicarboxylate transport system permease small subunit